MALSNTTSIEVTTKEDRYLVMKDIDRSSIAKVHENNPLQTIDKDIPELDSEALTDYVNQICIATYPELFNAGIVKTADEVPDFDPDSVADLAAKYKSLGIENIAKKLESQYADFSALRRTLIWLREEKLIRGDSLVPIRYLADIFLAVPVWYFLLDEVNASTAQIESLRNDPLVLQPVFDMCQFFKNKNWQDIFQLYNRRIRSLKNYNGELIPARTMARINKASTLGYFDYIVVATPYHDQAGKDWHNPNWLRPIDPYVLGIRNNAEFFVIIDRFSGTGVFPHFYELVADTISFLQKNKQALSNLNRVSWYIQEKERMTSTLENAGEVLTKRVDRLIRAFEDGSVFDWLRGKD